MIVFFIILQCVLLFFMLFHDWIPVPRLNDIPALKKHDSRFYRLLGSAINGAAVLVPLLLTLVFYRGERIDIYASIFVVFFYTILTLGTIVSWWVPYIFGCSQTLKQEFAKFKNTYHFLPARKDHIVPNTLHVILHLQVWTCFALSIYFLIQSAHGH